MKKVIRIYSDGGCRPNPGMGGIGVILKSTFNGKEVEKEIKKTFKETTNNRMELTAAITGIKAVKAKGAKIELYTDSGYVVNAFNKKWIESWSNKKFMKNGKERVNADLWKILYKLAKENDITFNWVKGHNGHQENERCDELATEAILYPEEILEDIIR